jgi:hypothetical protein
MRKYVYCPSSHLLLPIGMGSVKLQKPREAVEAVEEPEKVERAEEE